jgi:formiminotetrahydrofolate cyclodeaminase
MSYLDSSLREFLHSIAAREPAPGGGSVAAVTVAMAAGLVVMAARLSPDLPGCESMADDAERLRQRAAELADADAEAYGAVLSTLSATRSSEPAERRDRLRTAFEAAALVPLEVAELGADTARLAALLVEGGNPNLRGDAATGAYLAEAAVRSATALVAINVASGGCDTALLTRAARCTAATREAVDGVRAEVAE